MTRRCWKCGAELDLVDEGEENYHCRDVAACKRRQRS